MMPRNQNSWTLFSQYILDGSAFLQVMTVAGLKDVLMDAAEGMLEVSKLRSSAAALVYLTLVILIIATTLQWGMSPKLPGLGSRV